MGLCWLSVLLAGCGDAAPNRPEVVSAFPFDRQVLTVPLAAIRITYDDEVAILNPEAVEVRLFDEFPLDVELVQFPGEPCCIYVVPENGEMYPADSFMVVHITQGAVINADEQYAQDEFIYAFTTGNVPAYVGRGAVVNSLEHLALTVGPDIPTPGGRTVVGIQAMARDSSARVFVQLADGGGTGASLAWFAPGDAAMTPITLSSSGAGDLTATRRTLVPGVFGQKLFAAYRDEANGSVRLHRVDMSTGAEEATLQLSIPPGPDTRPVGIALDRDTGRLFVACDDGATGRQAYVDIAAFIELDQDPVTPGIQAHVLIQGAGPIIDVEDQGILAPPNTVSLTYTRSSNDTNALNGLPLAGLNSDIVRSDDRQFVLQALRLYDGVFGAVLFTRTGEYIDPVALEVTDDVGLGPTGATDIRAIAPAPSDTRFLAFLDTDVLVRWLWTFEGLTAEDLNPDVPGIQGADMSATLPGVTTISRTQGTFPTPLGP